MVASMEVSRNRRAMLYASYRNFILAHCMPKHTDRNRAPRYLRKVEWTIMQGEARMLECDRCSFTANGFLVILQVNARLMKQSTAFKLKSSRVYIRQLK